jgi:hypothetical protein
VSDDFLVRDTRQARHFWADNEVVDVYGSQLGPHAFAVYLVLCRYAQNGTGEVRISSRKIAAQIGMSPQGALNALDHLGRLGLILHVQAPTRVQGGLYLLADVKALVDPSYAQLKLTGKGVNPVDTSKGVNPVGVGVNPVDKVSTGWTRNKEDKTLLKTTRLNPPNPPLGGLTPRQLRNLSQEMEKIYASAVGCVGLDFDEDALRKACVRLCLPLEAARKAIADSYGEQA